MSSRISAERPGSGGSVRGLRPGLAREAALGLAAGMLLAIAMCFTARAEAPSSTEPSTGTPAATDAPAQSAPVTLKHRYTGRARRLSDVLSERGIRAGTEMNGHVVLQLDGGELLPILADWRGRAFYQDERLRERKVTLVANRASDLGYLQPLMIFTYDDQDRPQFTDYWCDVCAIPMFEIKPCECCQGEIRLRLTPQAPPEDVPEFSPGGS